MYNQKIMEAVVDAITESGVLDAALWETVEAQESSKVLSQVLEEVRAVCPEQLYARLDNAILGDGYTSITAALLCGMQIGSGLHQITASPHAMAEFMGQYLPKLVAH